MVDITPEASIYSIFRHISYKKWNAIAEFVDNSIQSFIESRDTLAPERILSVRIESFRDRDGGSRLIIHDNSFGIQPREFERAFKPGSAPINRSGLSEFGVGMKFAACFFSPFWSVCTTPYPVHKTFTFNFDVAKISNQNQHYIRPTIQDLPVHPEGGTTISLDNLYEVIAPATLGKIKSHLAGIYREFLKSGHIEIIVNNDKLSYNPPSVLISRPAWSDRGSTPIEWRQPLSIDLTSGKRVEGFVAIRERASRDQAGFALFRRGRVVVGSEDDTYRPKEIFGSSGGFEYQRIYGELHLHGFDVTHTKDTIIWGDAEDELIYKIKKTLENEPFLLRQAREYRVGLLLDEQRDKEISNLSKKLLSTLGQEDVQKRLSQAISRKDSSNTSARSLPPGDSDSETTNTSFATAIEIPNPYILSTPERDWEVYVSYVEEQSDRPLFEISEFEDFLADADRTRSSFTILINKDHPFIEKYSTLEPDSSNGLIALLIAFCVSEIRVRADGFQFTGAMRRCINELLKFL